MLLARAQADDGRRAAELLDQALATAGTLGMAALAEEIRTLRLGGLPGRDRRRGRAPGRRNLFRQEGEYWTVRFDGVVVRLKDAKGLHHLARLLTRPGQEVHVVDLEAAEGQPAASGGPRPRAGNGELAVRPDLGDAGELLDATAKAAYKARRDELRTELEEAESFNDPARAAKARAELAFLTDELARAVGLGGRDRRAASHAERARLNATRAIRAAMATSTGPTPPSAGTSPPPSGPAATAPTPPTPASRSSGSADPRDRRESPGAVKTAKAPVAIMVGGPWGGLTSPWSEPCYRICLRRARSGADAWGCVPEHERADVLGVSVGLGLGGALVGYVIFTLGLGIGDTDIFDWGGSSRRSSAPSSWSGWRATSCAAASQAQARPPLRPRPSRRHQLQVRLRARDRQPTCDPAPPHGGRDVTKPLVASSSDGTMRGCEQPPHGRCARCASSLAATGWPSSRKGLALERLRGVLC